MEECIRNTKIIKDMHETIMLILMYHDCINQGTLVDFCIKEQPKIKKWQWLKVLRKNGPWFCIHTINGIIFSLNEESLLKFEKISIEQLKKNSISFSHKYAWDSKSDDQKKICFDNVIKILNDPNYELMNQTQLIEKLNDYCGYNILKEGVENGFWATKNGPRKSLLYYIPNVDSKKYCNQINKEKEFEIKIEKGIPIPVQKKYANNRSKYPWEIMEVGDSFFIANRKLKSFNSTVNYTNRRMKKIGKKFCIKSVDGGVRIWRIQ